MKNLIAANERLINRVIQIFFYCQVKHLMKYLLEFITLLSNDNTAICKILFDKKIFEITHSYIRHFDTKTKIYSISLMIAVLNQLNINLLNEPYIIYSITTLISILKEDKNLPNKIKCVKELSLINKRSNDLQNFFYNVEGLELLLKEFRGLYTEDKKKEIEEFFKKIKERKNDKMLFEDLDFKNKICILLY